MRKLSHHFFYEDFACKCGNCQKEHRVHLGLVGGLEQLSGMLRKPVRVQMGARCQTYNQTLAAHRKSYHLQGKAAHINVDGVALAEVFKTCEKILEFRGLGYHPEENCVHVDTRSETDRWVKQGGKYHELTSELRDRHHLTV